ncbi:tetratricopeptide repeat-containing protein [Streptomyces beijiangensis]|uniref:Tetratricopeptide repeat protein n=1 Tax=Streptomyces beijiangensis TaxID=163361 RepID=A0A939FGS2_9ACTN|nr:tetratricopeptide repeat protein [Streptomyces beijiangensis]MBO0517122.1 tetratricopeptide repeat protein [Streptomyces beijiangensis]
MAPGDDTYKRALAEFAQELEELRIEHGAPSFRVIAGQAPPSRPLSPSAVSEVLSGKRLPSRDFLIALVRTLLAHDGARPGPGARPDPRLDHWRTRWETLRKLQAAERRTHGAPEYGSAFEDGPVDDTDTGVDAGQGESSVVEQFQAPAAADGTGDAPAIRVFVAMPGSTMGATAAWSDIAMIKRRLLEPVAEGIGRQMGCRTQLVIEKEKTATGAIHRSMFAEAIDSDVYIADLSGANANVYLELGVRWALRDGVTIPICQNIDDVRFNVSSSRVIPYGPGPDELDASIRQITEAAVSGLRSPERVDSPVRDGGGFVLIARAEHAQLHEEIRRLREQQAEDLVDAALKSEGLARRIELLQEAANRNPASWRAHFELGVALRKEGRYEEAEGPLRVCVGLKDDFAAAWREIGLTLSKRGFSDEEAVRAFDRAVALDGQDSETWATLGGLYRRLARKGGSQGRFETAQLNRALTCYQEAGKLSGNATYPLLNHARIEFLLTGLRGADAAPVLERFRTLEHLARFAVRNTAEPTPWAYFDLADTLLLTGRGPEGLAELRRGIDLIPQGEREGMLTSVAEPLQDVLSVDGLLTQEAAHAVRTAIEECVRALGGPDGDGG